MFYRKQKSNVQYIVSWTKDVGFTISSKKNVSYYFYHENTNSKYGAAFEKEQPKDIVRQEVFKTPL